MFNWLTQIADFMPHGMCLDWQPGLMALHVVSDAVIAASYFAIPIGIAVFVRRRTDLSQQHKALALLFAVFIAACGLTHVFSIAVLWAPYYGAEGVLKAFTALVSLVTAVALPFLLPQLLRIPSPRVLQAEIASHQATLRALEAARAQLAERVVISETETAATTRRFQAALKGSQVTVLEQDEALRYTWIYNPALGLDQSSVIGRTEADLLSPESVGPVQRLKRTVLESGVPRRAEFRIATATSAGWFDMRIEPVRLETGENGLVVTSTDISALKRQEEHLRVVMRELNHRSKNLLTIVMSLARQTSRAFEVPDAFLVRLEERLRSLASAHDELARQEWKGPDLRSVIEGQLKYQIESFPNRIVLDGAPCRLPAEAAHYVGMAIHELGSNAVKYGALSAEQGQVRISWRAESGDALQLDWAESGAAVVAPPARLGFGSTILRSLTPRALGGSATHAFEPSGVHWSLSAPLTPQEAEPEAEI